MSTAATVLTPAATAPEAALEAAPEASTVTALLALQAAYFERIREANAAGDAAAVQNLLLELDRKAHETSGVPATPPLALVKAEPALEAPPPSLYDQSALHVSLDTTVYDGDRDMHRTLVNDPHFADVAARILEGATPYNARKDLLKSALKLSPKLAPGIFAILERCRTNLGLTAEVELYVCSDTAFNAFCYPPVNGKYLIGVTSALLEKFEPDELAFVIGHEIGHAVFGHHRLPVQFLLHHGAGELSPLHAMKLYAWKRNAELSADRIGLICARNFDAAAQSFFKLSSGVTSSSLSFELKEYIAQFADLESEMATQDVDPEDWYSTHPFSPMRLKALDMFNRSETYLKLTAKEGDAELSEEQLEFEIKKIMSLMEPSYLQESSGLATLMRDFVFLGGYLVAAANGVISGSEVAALGTLLDPATVQERLEAVKALSVGEVKAEVATIAEKLNVMLPVVSKLNVIKDLTVIAGADGSVDEAELAALYEITEQLCIRHEFVDHVLSDAAEEGDE